MNLKPEKSMYIRSPYFTQIYLFFEKLQSQFTWMFKYTYTPLDIFEFFHLHAIYNQKKNRTKNKITLETPSGFSFWLRSDFRRNTPWIKNDHPQRTKEKRCLSLPSPMHSNMSVQRLSRDEPRETIGVIALKHRFPQCTQGCNCSGRSRGDFIFILEEIGKKFNTLGRECRVRFWYF